MTLLTQTNQPLIRWDWVYDHLDDIGARLAQHLALTVAAVALGLLVSVALSGIALRWRWSYPVISGTGAVLYTIPSLALFALLVPFTGLTATTAVIALATYTVFILVSNTVTSVTSVDDEVRDAAFGMGLERRQVLWRIDVPLALPAIVAGLRIATVTVIGLVTVTALLGLGGLGHFILDGFRRSIVFPTEIIVGVALSIALAGAVDLGFIGLERLLTPWAKRGPA